MVCILCKFNQKWVGDLPSFYILQFLTLLIVILSLISQVQGKSSISIHSVQICNKGIFLDLGQMSSSVTFSSYSGLLELVMFGDRHMTD